jgi:hypothetical protein
MSWRADVDTRLDRIKRLWRELERTRPASGTYNELIGAIRTESLAYLALLEAKPAGVPPDETIPPKIADLSPPDKVHVQLNRIKELWLELEGTRRTSARYKALIDLIHAESMSADGLPDLAGPDRPAS